MKAGRQRRTSIAEDFSSSLNLAISVTLWHHHWQVHNRLRLGCRDDLVEVLR